MMFLHYKRASITAGLVIFLFAAGQLAQTDRTAPEDERFATLEALERAFQAPPEDCKIMMRWWWFGPAVTHAELEREMRLMKDAGIGGFEVQPVHPLTVDDPAKGLVNLRYLSPEFLDAVRFTASTARQLGLRMDMTMGSGWPYGGPHISGGLAAARLRVTRLGIPKGTRHIPLPKIDEGEKFLAAFVGPKGGESFGSVATGKDGELYLPSSPPGPREVLVFIASKTGMMVKRPAVGAEGPVLDHYNRAALEKHLSAVGEPLADAAGPNGIRAMFCDSLEAYGSDWTADLLEQFQRRRGYDLAAYLPALVGSIGPHTAAIRHDWGQTLSELFDQRFMSPLQEWCHRLHVLLRVQSYGIPPAQFSSYRFVDLPEGEQGESGGWNEFTPARWASSAAHDYGLPVPSEESWTWVHSPVFRATPLDLKAGADQEFLEGITQLVGHGWPYSPENVEEPGWYFYASGALNQHNPWWPAMPDLALYLQRVSFLLRQGRPANDVALYLPEHDAWAQFMARPDSGSGTNEDLLSYGDHVNLRVKTSQRLGPTIVPRLLASGYNCDMVDDDAITRLGHIENREFVVGDQQFAIIVLPGIERIPPATLSKLSEFAHQGGILIATRRLPSAAPGFLKYEESTAKVVALNKELFAGKSPPAHLVANENRELGLELPRLYPPDITLSPPESAIGFIHRSANVGEIYFIANTSNKRVRTEATFRITGKKPEWWDPFTGKVSEGRVLRRAVGGTVVELELEPYGSRLLVFGDREERSGAVVSPESPLPGPLDLSHDWEVTFEGLGKKMFMDNLRSWTDEPETRFFSGRATYRKTILVPAEFLNRDTSVELDFGEPVAVPSRRVTGFQVWIESPVREEAEVYVNEQRAGTVWYPPYQLDVTSLLRGGQNELRIVVGNLAVNQMSGRPRPNYRELEARYGERFSVQDIEHLKPVPAGLMGPVRLIARHMPPSFP